MMVRVAIAQMDVKRGDPDANLERIRSYSNEAAKAGADVLGFPEMCTTGFDWKALARLKGGSADHLNSFSQIARECEIELFASLLEETGPDGAANALCYVNATGSVLARYRKIHRFSLFGEEKYVEAGDEIVVRPTRLGQTGFSICYDLRFPELFRSGVDRGARVFVLPAAFPHPRLAHWQVLLRARAIENQCFVIAVNQTGVEDDNESIRYFGHSTVIDPWGEVIFEAGEEEGLHLVNIDLGEVDKVREKMGALRDRRKDLFRY